MKNIEKFGYISDLHSEFWLQRDVEIKGKTYTIKSIEDYINYIYYNTDKSLIKNIKYLIVAGDISNNNSISIKTIDSLITIFKLKKIFISVGNHDYYLGNYFNNKRVFKLKEICKKRYGENVVFLDYMQGIIEIEGLKLAGTNIWYNLSDENTLNMFLNEMNDSNYISKNLVNKKYKFGEIFYNKVINDVDIFVSHVPFLEIVNNRYEGLSNYCYFNNQDIIKDKIYIFGHVHVQKELMVNESKIFINSIGYPGENTLNNISIKQLK